LAQDNDRSRQIEAMPEPFIYDTRTARVRPTVQRSGAVTPETRVRGREYHFEIPSVYSAASRKRHGHLAPAMIVAGIRSNICGRRESIFGIRCARIEWMPRAAFVVTRCFHAARAGSNPFSQR
jgi:hypothetical protein